MNDHGTDTEGDVSNVAWLAGLKVDFLWEPVGELVLGCVVFGGCVIGPLCLFRGDVVVTWVGLLGMVRDGFPVIVVYVGRGASGEVL